MTRISSEASGTHSALRSRGVRAPSDESGDSIGMTTSAMDQKDSNSVVAPDSAEATKGVSAFLGRVLDQLSITSWMPSVFLVGNAAVLLAMSGQAAPSVGGAIEALMGMEWGAVVVLLFSLVIAAVAIQAFEFESLRFFEGYNRSWAMKRFVERRIEDHQLGLAKLESSAWELQLRAFASAQANAERKGLVTDSSVVDWDLAGKLVRRQPLTDIERFLVRHGARAKWLDLADAAILHRWDLVRAHLSEYPEVHRILPTRLGNAMRAAEDSVNLPRGEDLEGFMIRNLDRLPSTIVIEHAAYRSRLEMYCGLIWVLVGLAGLSIGCLWAATDPWLRMLVPLAYLIGVWPCYKAAIASALGFGQALKEAARWVGHLTP